MKNPLLTFALIAMVLFSCTFTKTSDTAEINNKTSDVDVETIDFDAILNKHWKLNTLEGQAIKMVENQEDEVYFTLIPEENRLMAFSGCNTITGHYELEKGNHIQFSNMASTLKACPDVNIDESKFSEVFELADHYTIEGNKLSLKVGKRAPLAIFEAVDAK